MDFTNVRVATVATFLVGAVASGSLYGAPLVVLPNNNAEALASELIKGTGFSISSVTLVSGNTAGDVQQGTFSGGASVGLGVDSGVILTSGDARLAPGPNNATGAGAQVDGAGDPALSALLSGAPTFDANSLSFTFTPAAKGILQFRYVFASEEYNESIATVFDDVFGLFVNGVNIASIGQANRISINTINCGLSSRGVAPTGPGVNCALFVNNDFDPQEAPFDIQYDGFSVALSALIGVAAGQDYQFKFAIADAGDNNADSALFVTGQFRADDNGVPEPASIYLAALGILSLAGCRCWSRRSI